MMLSIGWTQPIFAPLQSDIRFVSELLSASLSIRLAAHLPHGEQYGLTLLN